MVSMEKRVRLEPGVVAYLNERNYPPEIIPKIVDFLLPLTQMSSIPRDAIRAEDDEALFTIAEVGED